MERFAVLQELLVGLVEVRVLALVFAAEMADLFVGTAKRFYRLDAIR